MKLTSKIKISLLIAFCWLTFTSVYPFLRSLDLTSHDLADYVIAGGSALIIAVIIPLIFSLLVIALFVFSFYEKHRLLYKCGAATFLLLLTSVVVITGYAFLPVMSFALIPLGYCCYVLRKMAIPDN